MNSYLVSKQISKSLHDINRSTCWFLLHFINAFLFPIPDLDECTMGVHSCEQSCHNTPGSYSCSCEEGFQLRADKRHCIGMSIERCGSHAHFSYLGSQFSVLGSRFSVLGPRFSFLLPTSQFSLLTSYFSFSFFFLILIHYFTISHLIIGANFARIFFFSRNHRNGIQERSKLCSFLRTRK